MVFMCTEPGELMLSCTEPGELMLSISEKDVTTWLSQIGTGPVNILAAVRALQRVTAWCAALDGHVARYETAQHEAETRAQRELDGMRALYELRGALREK
jgi:hypothetical protein